MACLEDLTVGARASGIVPGTVVTFKSVSWMGRQAVEPTFEDTVGRFDRTLVLRDVEHEIKAVTAGRPWSFEADGHLLRLVSEAHLQAKLGAAAEWNLNVVSENAHALGLAASTFEKDRG